MQIEIAEHERMSESGSSLLRLIQNNDTCRLDLLVRESVQNCLDAGDGTHDSVRVDFDICEFETSQVAGYFEKISRNLISRYPGKQLCIAIRDTNTVGLTGPVRYTDIKNGKFGNLLKLVYEISKPQDQSGSGGSWGLGKTVYFRIGMGLVLYYSRIKKDGLFGGFESRLSVALVEDETKENCLLPQSGNLQRGIAWWGSSDPKNKAGKHTIPVTKEREIEKILSGFHIKPYSGSETGTTIIIPFINERELMDETVPSLIDAENEYKTPFWCKQGIDEYLKIAFQRWYAPRLNNKKYKGQYLDVYINGEHLTSGKMAPVFRLVQSLYNSTPGEEQEFDGKKVVSKAIELRSTFVKGNSKAGFINYLKVTAQEMKMLEPDNYPNPYYYINKLSSDTMYNDPIILYTRKPGMIVSYATTGDWTDSIPKAAIGEYIVGLFVANSDNKLTAADITFEEYLRKSEKADHMAWDDWTLNGKNPQIISRLKKGVRKKIKDDFATITAGTDERKNLGLGKMLADALLPPTGFVYWDDAQGGTSGPGGTGGTGAGSGSGTGSGANNTSHIILKQTGKPLFSERGVQLPIRILFGKQKKAIIGMRVDSERGTISSSEWEKNVETAFPIMLKSITINSITRGKGKKQMLAYEGPITLDSDYEHSLFHIKYYQSSLFGITDELQITLEEVDNIILDGIISYSLDNVQGSIALKEGA